MNKEYYFNCIKMSKSDFIECYKMYSRRGIDKQLSRVLKRKNISDSLSAHYTYEIKTKPNKQQEGEKR